MRDKEKRETSPQLALEFEEAKAGLGERASVTSIDVIRRRKDRRILIDQLARTGIFREPSTAE